jgi:hypothetical protein
MRTSEQIDQIAKAMAEAQGVIKNPAKDKTNPHFKNTYADIASGLDVIRPALSKAGIAFFQATDFIEDGVVLVTRLVHGGSGQWVEGTYPVGKFGPHQQMASSLTYAKRQALFALVGVHGEDEDDDGEAAGSADTTTRRAPQRPQARPVPQGPDESQIACKAAVINKFIAAPTAHALDSEWKPAVEQMTAVGIDKNHEFYPAILQSFKDCKIALQERETRQHKVAAE